MSKLTLEGWIAYGVKKGWCSLTYCDTHDGVPLTETESELFDDGSDPCIITIRIGNEAEWEADAKAYREIGTN